MSDINWDDNARAAISEFAEWSRSMSKCGNAIDVDFFLKEFATRPQPEQPRKTVEDAGEWHVAEYGSTDWAGGEWTTIWLSDDGEFRWGDIVTDQTICTREQFEACVAAKVKSEPEWTHEINGLLCKVLNDKTDCLGNVVVELKDSGYATPRASTVKPIKPTITKADCELLVRFKNHIRDSDKNKLDDMLDDFINEHDITD